MTVLASGRALLRRARPALFVEYSPELLARAHAQLD